MCNLSKTKYCSAVQCPKMLWLKKFKPELFDESVMNPDILEQGKIVGEVAQDYFGEHVVVPFDETVPYATNLNKMVKITKGLMNEGTPVICEASFVYDTYFCSVDILKNLGNKHVELYEVKSSSHGVKQHPIYNDDVAYQVYVLNKLGYTVDKACLLHINSDYVRQGDIDLQKLFKVEDITDMAFESLDGVEENVKFLKDYMEQKEEPEMELGKQCFKPYACGFWKHCSCNLPQNNVFTLHGQSMKIATKEKLYRDGYVSFEDLENCDILKPAQKLQIKHAINDLDDEIDAAGISEWLNRKITYPVYHLDFETASWAVPEFDNSIAYEQIPFQFSLHIQKKRFGRPSHKEFLFKGKGDPRRAIAEKLIEMIPDNACITAYHASFEANRMKRLAELFPDLSDELNVRISHIKDLESPMLKKHYYNRAMDGCTTIKKVLPALFPNDPALDYHNLEEVHNGLEATACYKRLRTLKGEEKKKLAKNMLNYCKLDTFAMVKVLDRLETFR